MPNIHFTVCLYVFRFVWCCFCRDVSECPTLRWVQPNPLSLQTGGSPYSPGPNSPMARRSLQGSPRPISNSPTASGQLAKSGSTSSVRSVGSPRLGSPISTPNRKSRLPVSDSGSKLPRPSANKPVLYVRFVEQDIGRCNYTGQWAGHLRTLYLSTSTVIRPD
eukprot:sb/3472649/